MSNRFNRLITDFELRGLKRRLQKWDLLGRNLQTTLVRKKILGQIAESEWSKHLQINARFDVDRDWHRLPIQDYQAMQPFVHRVAAGQQSAMFAPSVHIRMLTLSSGTTGNRKILPLTDLGARQIKRAWLDWGTLLYAQKPDLLFGPLAHLTSDWHQEQSPAGIPIGDLSGFVAHNHSPLIRSFYVMPEWINKVGQQHTKYLIYLMILLTRDDFFILSTATPATLISLAQMLQLHGDRLIRSFCDRTVPDSLILTKDQQRMLLLRLKHISRSRLRFLKELNQYPERFHPAAIWPNLRLVCCWTGGTMSRFRNGVVQSFAPQTWRDIGYNASEGCFTTVTQDDDPSGWLRSWDYHFEFLRQDDPIRADYLLDETQLVEGQTYQIVVSSVNGLIRYPMRDLVRFKGFEGSRLRLEFLQKDQFFADLTGEKVSAYHCDRSLAKAFSKFGIGLAQGFVAPTTLPPFGYNIYIEAFNRKLTPKELATIAEIFDQSMAEENFIYDEHRRARKLDPPHAFQIKSGTYQELQQHRLEKFGGSIEQYKYPCLITVAEEISWLKSRTSESTF